MRILVVDDEPSILEPLLIALQQEEFEVVPAADGGTAWELFSQQRPDFALLDLTMPGLDGMALARKIVDSGEPRVPIILMTGRGEVQDKVAALNLGADDYLVKPFHVRELTARIRAVWRRARIPAKLLSAGDLVINPVTHEFFVEGRRVDVTAIEFLVLLTLIERADQVVHYSALMHKVWGYQVSHDLLRVTVFRLRKKIEPRDSKPKYIRTIAGVGFIVPTNQQSFDELTTKEADLATTDAMQT